MSSPRLTRTLVTLGLAHPKAPSIVRRKPSVQPRRSTGPLRRVLLDPFVRVAAPDHYPSRSQVASFTARPARADLGVPRPLAWLGLAERRQHIEGHPRIRERVLEGLYQRRRRQRAVTASAGILLVIMLVAWGAVRSPLLAVESVEVVGAPAGRTGEVVQAAGLGPGGNVLDVDLDEVSERVEALPWVDEVVVRRRLPSTVEIRVAARQPVLAGTFGDAAYLLDLDGRVIEQAADAAAADGLPSIELVAAPVVGSTVPDPGVAAAAEVAATLPAGLAEWVLGYRVAPDGGVDVSMRVPSEQGAVDLVAHIGSAEDLQVKALTLASLIEETVGRGMRPRALDVRIPDRPVALG